MGASRRDLLRGALGALAGSALAGCGLGSAPPAPTLTRIALLTGVTGDAAAVRVNALRQGLNELGYTEGREFALDVRYLSSDPAQNLALVDEVVGLGATVIVSGNPAGVDAARKGAPELPIVLAGVYADPVVAGVAESLAKPGGNVTGLLFSIVTLPARHLQILLDVVPSATTIGWLQERSVAALPTAVPVREAIEATARSRGVTLVVAQMGSPDDVVTAFGEMRRVAPQALLVGPGAGLIVGQSARLAELAREQRLPSMFTGVTDPVRAGGLIGGGVDQIELYRRAASYVDKIVKGAKPGDLPIEYPSKFVLVINLKTASELGLTIPQAVLSQATEVIR